MSIHSSHKDPAAKVVLLVSLLLILATVFVLISSLFSTISKNSIVGEIDTDTLVENNASMVRAKIEPIGKVTTSDGSGAVAAGPARSGEDVYTAVCAACHGTGAAGAPKIDDKAAWKPRVANGFDVMMDIAINGKGAMPARGGQNVPDAELKTSIAYMITKAGFNLDIPKDEAPAQKEEKAGKEETAKTEQKTELEQDSPASTTDSEKSPSSPSTPDPAEKPEAVTTTATQTTEQKTAISGENVYKKTCSSCHTMGVAGSPKTGDSVAWKARIAKGDETLYTSAIKGLQSETGVMPPKGGNFSLSDDEVKAAVDYMVSQVK